MHSIKVRNENSMDIAVFYLLYHIEFLENGMDFLKDFTTQSTNHYTITAFLKDFKMISGKGQNIKGAQPVYYVLIM